MEPYFQVGFVVPDLEPAMQEFAAGLGVEMVGPQERDLGDASCASPSLVPHRRTSS